MYCNNCGTYNEDGARFCCACGSELTYSAPPAPAPEVPFAPARSIEYETPAPYVVPDKRVRTGAAPSDSVIKSVVGSPVFLIGTILQTISVLLGLFNTLGGSLKVSSITSLFNLPSSFKISSDNMIISYVLLSLIPGILIITGLWISYGSAKSQSRESITTAGFSMIKVVMIIDLIVLCVIATIVFISLIAATSAERYYSKSSNFAVVLSVLIAAFVFALIFLIQVMKSIGVVKYSVVSKNPAYHVSGFVAVVMFICAAFLAISSFYGIVTRRAAFSYTPLSFVSALISAAALILFGISIFQYRHRMADLQSEN